MDFKPANFSADNVLQVLQAQTVDAESWPGWAEGCGPFFDTEPYEGIYAGGRLTVFRSRDGAWWVLCIEAARSTGFGGFYLSAWLYGNCVRTREEMFDNDLSRALFVLPDDVPLPSAQGRQQMIPRHDFSILRNGRRERFTPSEEQLSALGLIPSTREKNLGVMPAADLLRFLCDEWGDSLFASEDTLRDLIQKTRADFEVYEGARNWGWNVESEMGLPDALPDLLDVFLQTRQWTHPRWNHQAWQNPQLARPPLRAFEVLARAIASGDLSEWNQQDPSVFNSHWKNWGWGRGVDDERVVGEDVVSLDALVQGLAPAEQAAFLQEAHSIHEENAEESIYWMALKYFNSQSEHLFGLGLCLIHIDPNTFIEWLRRRANRSEPQL